MEVLITGGTGYIGSTIALDLARRGHRVTAVARARGSSAPSRVKELLAAGVSLVHADLSRPGELSAAVEPRDVEVLVHGVCSFLEPTSNDSLTLRAMDEVLALGARCPRLRQAITLGNNLVLDPRREDDFPDEDYPCEPVTRHGQNKLEVERRLERSGLPWVVLRIPQVYGGVGSSFDWIMVDPIQRRAFPVPCDGKNRVSLVHVDDVAQAVRLVIERGARDRRYNVASGERDLTLGAVFDEVARGFGLPPPRRLPRSVALTYMGAAERWARLRGRDPETVSDMVRALAANRTLDIARARAELGFAPEFPDTLAGIRSSYAAVFAGRAKAFVPAGRLAAATEQQRTERVKGETALLDHKEFWRRWQVFRHGDPGAGNFADVMRVLHLHEDFGEWSIDQLGAGRGGGAVTVLDLACGAAQLAGPLERALRSRGRTLARYIGVDDGEREWIHARVARELSRNGLEGRSAFLHHDLSAGLPPDIRDHLGAEGDLLIVSCWGITYLPRPGLLTVLHDCARLTAAWPAEGGALLSVNLTTSGELDRRELTRRFLTEVVPSHLRDAVRERSVDPARRITLALRGLPGMRRFGAELKERRALLPAADFVALLGEAGHPPSTVDGSALWGQMTCVAVPLPRGA